MKKLFTFLAGFILFISQDIQAQFCSTSGNVVIFANYDGGDLTINVDEDIPNLKIGICTYEAVTINITGPFASNVTAVQYAGFDSYNNHCSQVVANTTINGVSSSITEVLFAPPATFTTPEGYGSIICAYSCDTDWQGGCNTAEQIVDYFVNEFDGELLMYYTQYGCWPAQSIAISGGGTCCPGIEMTAPVADINFSDTSICPGECVTITDASTNEPTEWTWTFQGANVSTSSIQNPGAVCFDAAGNYQITLTATNIYGSTVAIEYLTVEACAVPGCTYQQATNYNPAATVDDHSCVFNCGGGCPGDFNDDGFISVADLILFVAAYGSVCPN
ncbi:MAG: PKD domain-containing protein [Flavobacteriales bacterium]|nr:PKD domain-containing protein [Flavobacteriales bacterium]